MQFDIKKVMVAVTAPPENIKEIRNAMCEAGAGIMGDYTHCSINMNNVATFIPNEQANPYIGQNNKLEFVEEVKIEVICDVDKVNSVIKAARKVHPYEEPGIIIYPLLDEKDFN